MAETKQAPAAQAPQPTFNPMAFPQQQFEPAYERNPDQEKWIEMERERTERDNAQANALMQKIAESGIMFHNIPATNEQFIGKIDKTLEVQSNGVPTSTIRSVPLGPEAFSPGRQVRWPDGSTSLLGPGITSVEQIIHPITGESLIEPVTASDIKAAGEKVEDVRDGGALGIEYTPTSDFQFKNNTVTTTDATAARTSTKTGAKGRRSKTK